MQLRDYQRESLNATYESWRTKKIANPLLVLPTGSGKSAIIAAFVQEAMQAFPTTRIVMATHVKELVEQNGSRLKEYWPQAPLGYYAASMRKREKHAPVLFGSIQSMVGHEWELQGADVLIIDEAHLLSPDETSNYRKFISEMRKIKPSMRIMGLTATPYRLDSGMLTEGKDALFDGISYEVPIKLLLERGFLAPLITPGTKERLDLSGVGTNKKDFVQTQLQAATNKSDINERIVNEAIKLGENRGHWLAFCVGIDHAESIRDLLRAKGISAETVSSRTPAGERDKIIKAFKSGQVKCLTNADVLTTGFDAPLIDYMIMIRATTSPVLYVQMLGRGMRIADGKTNCLVADFAGNIFRHGPVDDVKPPRGKNPKAIPGAPIVKECPSCALIVPVQTVTCQCGHMWPRDYFKKLEEQAAQAAFISGSEQPFWVPVSATNYSSVSNAAGTRDMLKVEYFSGTEIRASELVLVEHPSSAFAVEQWWRSRAKVPVVPGTVQAALHLADDLRKPIEVQIVKRGRYYDVIGHRFGDE